MKTAPEWLINERNTGKTRAAMQKVLDLLAEDDEEVVVIVPNPIQQSDWTARLKAAGVDDRVRVLAPQLAQYLKGLPQRVVIDNVDLLKPPCAEYALGYLDVRFMTETGPYKHTTWPMEAPW